jgi:hypothetical protein
MKPRPLFEESQYLGFNKMALLRNLVFVLFCFLAYYLTEEREKYGDLFFFTGAAILGLSIVFLFVRHLRTRVYPGHLELDGLWSMRKVRIDFAAITGCEETAYSKYRFNNPAYNLHRNGVIRFFTTGRGAVRLTAKDGLQYLVGTQRAGELCRVIRERIAVNG